MWTKIAVTYGYKIEISLENIIGRICEKIIDNPDDWELDGEMLIIRGAIHTGCNIWHCNATRESPAEWEAELNTNIEDEDIQGIVLDALHRIKRDEIGVDIEIDDSSDWDYEESEPDPDRAYDEWKDRQYDKRRF